MSVQNTVTSQNLYCRSLYCVLSPMFMNRNAQWLSLLNTVPNGDRSTHVSHSYAWVGTHTCTHTALYKYFTATKEEMFSRVPILQPLVYKRWRHIPVHAWLEILRLYVKQLSGQSGQSENYSNKDIIMVQFHCFNQTFESEWILIEEARLQSHLAQRS